MAKMTKSEWSNARQLWESDKRDGHQWLADSLVMQGFDVNRASVAMAAKRQGWVKGGAKVTKQPPTVTKKNVTVTKKVTHENVTKPEPAVTRPNKQALIESGNNVSTMGRDTLYKTEYNEKAYELCLMGATDDVLAHVFGVSEKTIDNWKVDYPEFLRSIHAGKDFADAKMANAMYKSGLGLHVVTEDKLVYNDGVSEVVTLTKQIPPEVKAQIHWLNNRQSKKWRNNIVVDPGVNLDQDTIKFLSGEFEDRLRAIRENAAKLREERGLTINGEVVGRD